MAETDDMGTKVEASLDRIAGALADGWDVSDLALVVRESMEVAEHLEHANGAAKQQFATEFASALLDQFLASCTPKLDKLIEEIDVPFLPEAIERVTVDPILKKWAPLLIQRVAEKALPSLFTLVVDASRGKISVNTERCQQLAETGMPNAPTAPCVLDPGHDGPCRITKE